MSKVTEAISLYLNARMNEHNGPDLIARWTPEMETQLNVSSNGGTPVEGKPSTYENDQFRWWNIRVPKKANSDPVWNNYELNWPLDYFAEAIGSTGWNWVKRESMWVGFDFDSITGHAVGVGITDDQLELVKQKASELPYVEVRKSTGGSGIHIYVLLDGIPTANHTEHAALARCILARMSTECGFDFASQVDTCGGNLWIWHRKMTPENEGLKLIKASTQVLAEADVPDWRDHIKAKSTTATTASSGQASAELIKRAQQYVANCDGVGEGGRNKKAFSIAGHCYKFIDDATKARLNEHQIVSLLRVWNDKNSPPLSDDELRQCIASAMNSSSPRPDEVVEAPIDLDEMFREATDETAKPKSVERFTFAQLRAEHPNLNRPVIDGLIREGETCNIISHTKVGKSWLGYGLLLSVVTGQPWLGFDTAAGEALLIDNELHKSTLSNRIESVADAMEIHNWQDRLHVWPLRGNLRPLHMLELDKIEPGQFKLIVLDAMYRFNISGVSENDNAAMATFYNTLDRIADRTKAAIVVVHHTTKGNQSNKRVTDVGAGAGAQSRAADCHLVIREHENEGVMVLDAAVRSFAPIDPVSIRWEFPLWLPDGADPTQLKTEPNRRQAANDIAGMNAIKTALTDSPATVSELRKRTNFGKDRVERLVGMMVNNNIISRREVTIQRRQCEQFHLAV